MGDVRRGRHKDSRLAHVCDCVQGCHGDRQVLRVIDEPKDLHNELAAAAQQRICGAGGAAIQVKWSKHGEYSNKQKEAHIGPSRSAKVVH